MFEKIYKLGPCTTLTLNGKHLVVSKYKSYAGGVDTGVPLIERINEAVNRQLISDRPVGVYLSGGIDSTTVLNAVSRVRNRIVTFSVGFELEEGEEPTKFNSDLLIARETARHYSTDHHEVLIKKDEITTLLEEAVYALDEPIANPTVIPMIKLARYAKKSVAVVLGGDGGDELFGGYERYKLSLLAYYYQKIPSFLRLPLNMFPGLAKLNTSPGIDQFSLFMFQKNPVLRQVIKDTYTLVDSKSFFKEKLFENMNMSGPELLMNADLRSWLVDESLMRSDKTSMAHGLELRVPLLDLEIKEYACSIPFYKKLNIFSTKKLLRKTMKDHIPNLVFKQPKRGWFSPGAKWLRDPHVYDFVKNVLNPSYYEPSNTIFDWRSVNKILEDHVLSKNYNSTMLWAIIMFQIWAKRYKIEI